MYAVVTGIVVCVPVFDRNAEVSVRPSLALIYASLEGGRRELDESFYGRGRGRVSVNVEGLIVILGPARVWWKGRRRGW